MKAVGYRANWPVDHAEALLDVELPAPVPGARDVLVRVKAVSVNPVDTKVRKGSQPPEGQVKVLGWEGIDAAHKEITDGIANYNQAQA